MCVVFHADGSFFVYYCEGPEGRAYAHIRDALGIEPINPAEDLDRDIKIKLAGKIWAETAPAPGTLVETYLRGRGITLPIPDCIRFHGSLGHPSRSTWPAMVTQVLDMTGAMLGVHRTYLNHDGRKAPVEPVKITLGPVGGCAARLAPIAPKLIVGEGIETVLSAMQLSGLPGWAALSTGGMKAIQLPPPVKAVCVAIDVDPEGWGEKAAQTAKTPLHHGGARRHAGAAGGREGLQ
jgi:hypothetical protein